MKIKQITIKGKPRELEFIVRVLCGIMMITQLSSYHNLKDEGKIVLEANRE